MPLQLRRILTLLLSLIIIFIIGRHFLIPESFGEYGHYRANSLIENQAHVPKYQGNENCIECHEEQGNLLAQGLHQNIKCETCHGPGNIHNESNEAVDIIKPKGRDFCAKCHAINPARNDKVIKQVNVNEHNIEESECVICHNPHEPWN